MVNALIPVTTGTIGARATLICNARDLHIFLEVGRDFATWIKDRIAEYGFVEGEDFAVVQNLSSPNSGSAKARSQKITDYHLSLDMAKELGMVERTEQGRKIRRYFIACEAEKLAAQVPEAKKLPAAKPLLLPAPRLSAEALAAIDARAGQIAGSTYAEVRQWLLSQVLAGCIHPDGTPLPNFAATLAGADFAAFTTQHANKHLETIAKVLQFIQGESGALLARVQLETNRLKGQP